MDSDSPYPSDLDLKRNGATDLLEIYHARQVRSAIVAQLDRLCLQHQGALPGVLTPAEGLCIGELSVFYDTLLLNIEHLLTALGDCPTDS